MDEITAGAVWRSLPRRDPAGHKGMFGKVMCLCGCVGFTGAPVFASRAAVLVGFVWLPAAKLLGLPRGLRGRRAGEDLRLYRGLRAAVEQLVRV